MTAAKELKAKAPESSYAARGLIQKSHSLDEWFRELEMASTAMRQANQPLHSFSMCARSISCLLRRMPSKDWKRGVNQAHICILIMISMFENIRYDLHV